MFTVFDIDKLYKIFLELSFMTDENIAPNN